MLIAVRHGSTNYNGEHEKLRGWLNLHLSPEGVKEAQSAAGKVKNLVHNNPVHTFHSSDLLRAMQTADAVKHKINFNYQPTKDLRDWNIGHFSGLPVNGNVNKLHSYIDNPDIKVPGGESYDSFVGHVDPLLHHLVKSPDTHVIVTHNRIITRLAAIAKTRGKGVDIQALKKKGPIEPGGVMVVNPDWSFHSLE